jgi:hypothetical protein
MDDGLFDDFGDNDFDDADTKQEELRVRTLVFFSPMSGPLSPHTPFFRLPLDLFFAGRRQGLHTRSDRLPREDVGM